MSYRRFNRSVILMILLSAIIGCSVYAKRQLDTVYGASIVRDREITDQSPDLEYHRDVKPILDQRCVVCHGCYDAPCQLKMESFEGVDRGLSNEKVYHGSRLIASELSRLSVDASSTASWREKGFYPVLNERNQTAAANLEASVLYRSLALKKENPLPSTRTLPSSFDFRLNRDQQCSAIEDFDDFESNYPLWGMPYGLPEIEDEKFAILTTWLAQGGRFKQQAPLNVENKLWVDKWEEYLNGSTLKQQLVSRYIYEHLFAGHIYFKESGGTVFFELLRSSTPPGEPLNIIATRRPYDDPGVDRVYYRFRVVDKTIVAKNHMPYLLDESRMQRWHEIFSKPDFTVNELPTYDAGVAGNPFVAFKDIPVKSRYKFMLDEAHFTIMGFIKGPVCRGQIALNVINDHFWVMFVEPDLKRIDMSEKFLSLYGDLLSLPSQESTNIYPIRTWLKYSKLHQEYVVAREEFSKQYFPNGSGIDLDIIWDGNGENKNSALTVFRHFDSASVVKGHIGKTPKTAWVIDYTLLEKIHYLLVSGFDVYGNVGHQLVTRLYFDFLRMEGENNFLSFLPKDAGVKELKHWYLGAEDKVQSHIDFLQSRERGDLGISYQSDDPKEEFLQWFRERAGGAVEGDELNRPQKSEGIYNSIMLQLQRLASIKGSSLSYLPELAVLRLGDGEQSDKVYTLIRNRSHSNVSAMYGESARVLPSEQTLTVIEGVVGSYPNVFLQVSSSELRQFVDDVSVMQAESDYSRLLDLYGIRRNSEFFWTNSDWINQYYMENSPVEAGLLDYNRLENR